MPNLLKERSEKKTKYENQSTTFEEKIELKNQIENIDKKSKNIKIKKRNIFYKILLIFLIILKKKKIYQLEHLI